MNKEELRVALEEATENLRKIEEMWGDAAKSKKYIVWSLPVARRIKKRLEAKIAALTEE